MLNIKPINEITLTIKNTRPNTIEKKTYPIIKKYKSEFRASFKHTKECT